jgi:hypothetical protein
MKLSIESTSAVVDFKGRPARIWNGTTDGGGRVLVFVATIAVPRDASPEEMRRFEEELREVAVNDPDLDERLRGL